MGTEVAAALDAAEIAAAEAVVDDNAEAVMAKSEACMKDELMDGDQDERHDDENHASADANKSKAKRVVKF